MRLLAGVVTDIIDAEKFIIKFTIKNYIDNCIAYPLNVLDEPKVGESIILHEIDSDILGNSFLYQLIRLEGYTELVMGKSVIKLEKDQVSIKSNNSDVTIDNLGNITINSNKNIVIKGKSSITLDGPNINLKGVSGAVGFNSIPICPYSGQKHISLNCT